MPIRITRIAGSAVYAANVEKSGAKIVRSRAVFEDPHTLRLSSGETVRARTVLIATGGAPQSWPCHSRRRARDPAVGRRCSTCRSRSRRRLADPAAAATLRLRVRLASSPGSAADVTLRLYRGAELVLRGFDDDVRAHRPRRDGQEERRPAPFGPAAAVSRDRRARPAACASRLAERHGGRRPISVMLAALGRRPERRRARPAEQAGVRSRSNARAIAVDDALFRSRGAAHLHAIGDVTDRVQPDAGGAGRGEGRAVDRLFGARPPRSMDCERYPDRGVHASPNVGTVGPDRGAGAQRQPSRVAHLPQRRSRPLKHTLSGRDERTLMKLVVDEAQRPACVGVHMVGADAGEIVQALRRSRVKARRDQGGVRRAPSAIHPTAAEELVTDAQPDRAPCP
ncbi:MAG: hypothetical protein MZV49_10515 [Rhodopseudomonas palustris]|nr:hypothetical protein [Rhodopseudomonas palustris]